MKKNNSINAALTQTGIAPKSSIKFLKEINYMRANRFNRIVAVTLTIVMTFMLISPALVAAKVVEEDKTTGSQEKRDKLKTEILDDLKNQDGRKEFSPEELEQMRSALLDLLDTVQVLTTLRSADGGFGEKSKGEDYESLKAQIQQMSGKELNVLRAALDPSKMRATLAKSRAVLDAFKNRAAAKSSRAGGDSPGFPQVNPYCDDIPTTAEYRAAEIALLVAEGVRDVAQNGCNEVIVALGFGGNGRLVCLITDAIYIAAKGATFDITFCYEDYTGALTTANYERLDHLHEDVEDVKSSNSENFSNIINNAAANTTTITGAVTTATTTIVNNDNSNKDTLVTNAATNTTTITTAVTDAKTTIVNNDNSNKDTIINNDNNNKTMIVNNDNTNKDTIVTNDNTNKITIVNNDNANTLALTNLVNSALSQILTDATANKNEMKNLLLRTQIEADLASTDGSTFVALYETPVTVCFPSLNSLGLPQLGIPASVTQCGLLDLVRSIVQQTIANVGAGTNAQSFFNTGDAQRAAGQYKAAYTSYRKAYKAASN